MAGGRRKGQKDDARVREIEVAWTKDCSLECRKEKGGDLDWKPENDH